jgi:hypothetical protein
MKGNLKDLSLLINVINSNDCDSDDNYDNDVTEDCLRCVFSFYIQSLWAKSKDIQELTVAAGSSMDVTLWRIWPDRTQV